jgi:hypothetical protein
MILHPIPTPLCDDLVMRAGKRLAALDPLPAGCAHHYVHLASDAAIATADLGGTFTLQSPATFVEVRAMAVVTQLIYDMTHDEEHNQQNMKMIKRAVEEMIRVELAEYPFNLDPDSALLAKLHAEAHVYLARGFSPQDMVINILIHYLIKRSRDSVSAIIEDLQITELELEFDKDNSEWSD